MTAAATTETAPVEHFHSLYEHRSFALERDEMRAAALERLRQTGFPLRHNESWAHTPLRDLLRRSVASRPVQCSREQCARRRDCPFGRRRSALAKAHLIVANHDLLLRWPPDYPPYTATGSPNRFSSGANPRPGSSGTKRSPFSLRGPFPGAISTVSMS